MLFASFEVKIASSIFKSQEKVKKVYWLFSARYALLQPQRVSAAVRSRTGE